MAEILVPEAPEATIDPAGKVESVRGDGNGNLCSNPASGAPVALTNPPAALTANQDTTLAFVSPVRHLLIQNNSGTDCQIDFDTAASPGAFNIKASGSVAFFDVPCNTLHVYSTAATPVNGNAGTNLVIRGWS